GHGAPQIATDEMTAICEEDHNAGIRVAAHAQSAAGITAALRAGVDTIEHGAGMTTEMVALFHHNPRSLTGSSSLVPTLQACIPLVKLDRNATGISDIAQQNATTIVQETIQGIQDARANDITIGMGTDSGLTHVTHYNTWRELDFVTSYGGLTPAETLHAATRANAALLGNKDVTGSSDVGKTAASGVWEDTTH